MEHATESAETACAQTEEVKERVSLMLSCAKEAFELASAAELAEDLSRAKHVAAFAADCASTSLELARRHAARAASAATRALLLRDPDEDASRAESARARARAAFATANEQTLRARELAVRAYFVDLGPAVHSDQ